ncbi:hypothetical protein AB0K14_34780 [Actinosynnema sp. NPDC050801]
MPAIRTVDLAGQSRGANLTSHRFEPEAETYVVDDDFGPPVPRP